MFPFDHNNNQLSFKISSDYQQEDTIRQDLTLRFGNSSADSFDHSHNIAFGSNRPTPRRRFTHKPKDDNDNDNDNDKNKRIMHREVERRRRQEMATLFTSLRDQLPLEYLKGKRAVSDHVDQAVKYIQDLQKKIEELSLRRDEIKKLSNLEISDPEITENKLNSSSPAITVMVRSCLIGVEVVISCTVFGKQVFQLSRVVELLIEHGLDVVNCISTKMGERIIYTIQSEISYFSSINISELQNKLIEAIPSSSSENFK